MADTRERSPAKDHRELRVYKLAFESALQIHELSKSFPSEERYSLVDQMRRSSRSVCANIAEEWRRRRYPKNFVSKLVDAASEASETQIWLDFASSFEYMDEAVHADLYDNYDHIARQLSIMMSESHKWKPRQTN